MIRQRFFLTFVLACFCISIASANESDDIFNNLEIGKPVKWVCYDREESLGNEDDGDCNEEIVFTSRDKIAISQRNGNETIILKEWKLLAKDSSSSNVIKKINNIIQIDKQEDESYIIVFNKEGSKMYLMKIPNERDKKSLKKFYKKEPIQDAKLH